MTSTDSLLTATPATLPIFDNVSDDDFIWVYPCTLDEVIALIRNPKQWIHDLNGLERRCEQTRENPRNYEAGKEIVLADNFMIRLTLWNEVADLPKDKQFLVQGISGTGAITVRRSADLQFSLRSNWPAYWEEWKTGRSKLDACLVLPYKHGFAHMEVADGQDPEASADRVAAFLVAGALWTEKELDPNAEQPDAPLLNRILGLTPTNLKIHPEDGSCPEEIEAADNPKCFRPVSQADLKDITFTFMGVLDDYHLATDTVPCPTPPCPVPPGCFDGAGTLVTENGNSYIKLDEVIVKNYAMKVAPTPPAGGG